jgi:hypothetical protein
MLWRGRFPLTFGQEVKDPGDGIARVSWGMPE